MCIHQILYLTAHTSYLFSNTRQFKYIFVRLCNSHITDKFTFSVRNVWLSVDFPGPLQVVRDFDQFFPKWVWTLILQHILQKMFQKICGGICLYTFIQTGKMILVLMNSSRCFCLSWQHLHLLLDISNNHTWIFVQYRKNMF